MKAYPFCPRSMKDICQACGRRAGLHYTKRGRTLCRLEGDAVFLDSPEVVEIDKEIKAMEQQLESLLERRAVLSKKRPRKRKAQP